jgi:hypothetical protein
MPCEHCRRLAAHNSDSERGRGYSPCRRIPLKPRRCKIRFAVTIAKRFLMRQDQGESSLTNRRATLNATILIIASASCYGYSPKDRPFC